jgi:hypothetical protein
MRTTLVVPDSEITENLSEAEYYYAALRKAGEKRDELESSRSTNGA